MKSRTTCRQRLQVQEIRKLLEKQGFAMTMGLVNMASLNSK